MPKRAGIIAITITVTMTLLAGGGVVMVLPPAEEVGAIHSLPRETWWSPASGQTPVGE